MNYRFQYGNYLIIIHIDEKFYTHQKKGAQFEKHLLLFFPLHCFDEFRFGKPIIAFVITNIVVIHTEQIYFFETHIYSKYYCLNTKFVSYPCHPSYINVSRTIQIIIINIVITFAAGIVLLPSTVTYFKPCIILTPHKAIQIVMLF